MSRRHRRHRSRYREHNEYQHDDHDNQRRSRSRRRRHRHAHSGFASDFGYKRRNGWGYNLYRNTREGKIAGVAAGLADYWDIEPWVARLLWIALFLFTGTLAFWLYIGAWIMLAPKSSRRLSVTDEAEAFDDEIELDTEYDEIRHQHRPRNVFRYSESTSVRLQRARDRLDGALRRVEDMESYVTSRRYNLNKEFSRL